MFRRCVATEITELRYTDGANSVECKGRTRNVRGELEMRWGELKKGGELEQVELDGGRNLHNCMETMNERGLKIRKE